MLKQLFITFLVVGTLATAATAGTLTVPGTSDPWLAGMPAGALDNVGTPEPPDVAPAQSPVFAMSVSGGTLINWSASGIVGHPGDLAGPDGASLVILPHFVGANNGISDVTVPVNALLGVFLSPSQPDLNPAPGALDFSTQASQDYLSLSPALQQVFFMGDGLTSGSIPQSVMAPAGATRLFLGTMDGWGWANNAGEFEVTVRTSNAVPDSCQLGWLALVGVLALGTFHRRAAMRAA